MERAIDWVLIIGIFIIFPISCYLTYDAVPQMSGLGIGLVASVATVFISAIFVTPIMAIIAGLLDFYGE